MQERKQQYIRMILAFGVVFSVFTFMVITAGDAYTDRPEGSGETAVSFAENALSAQTAVLSVLPKDGDSASRENEEQDEREALPLSPPDILYERVRDDTRAVCALGELDATGEELAALTELLLSHPYGISLKAVRVDGERGLSFNSAKTWFSASIIKAPFCLYVCRELDAGNASPDELLRYTADSYHSGAGSLQQEQIGTHYPVSELILRALYESDNIAYAMLYRRFGKDGYNRIAEEADAPTMKLASLWGCHPNMEDMLIMWYEIYRYFRSGAPNARLLYESMTSDQRDLFGEALPDNVISQKFGRMDYSLMLNGAVIYDAAGDYLLCIAMGTRETPADFERLHEILTAVHALMTR